jgi:hypothetical protein
MLEGLRESFAEWAVDGAGVQVARQRFLLACAVLGVPHEQIAQALPGWNPGAAGCVPNRRLAYYPDDDPHDRPETEPYYFRHPERWMKAQMERYKSYLEAELKKAEQYKADAAGRGTVVVTRPHTARHRTRELDLAERYFVAVRHKVLGHRYADIAVDHTRPRPNTALEMERAVSRLRVVVCAVCKEVLPYKKLKNSRVS